MLSNSNTAGSSSIEEPISSSSPPELMEEEPVVTPPFLTLQDDTSDDPSVIISFPTHEKCKISEPIAIQIITINSSSDNNKQQDEDRVECSLPLCRFLQMVSAHQQLQSSLSTMVATIPVSTILLLFKFDVGDCSGATTTILKLKFKGDECEIVVNQKQSGSEPLVEEVTHHLLSPSDDTPDEAHLMTDGLWNRYQELSSQLALIIGEQNSLFSNDDDGTQQQDDNLTGQLNKIFTHAECRVQWVADMVQNNKKFKTVSTQVIQSLSKVFKIKIGTRMEDVSHPMINYGINKNGLRFILFLLCNCKVIPEPSVIKYAVIAEARYGSYRNAEMLATLLYELLDLGIFEWKSGKLETNSIATSQLLIIYSLLIRHAPSSNIAVYYYECVRSLSKRMGFKLAPVFYACVIFSLVISCKSSEDPNDRQVETMKDLIEHYYAEGTESNNEGGNDEILNSIYINYKKESTNLVPSPMIEDSETDFDDNASCITFSSTLTSDITIRPTNHANQRMFHRNITQEEVKRCIKHGIRKLSKDVVKCTDENCIVIYNFEENEPKIITVYRHTKVRTPDITNSELCDYLITQGYYGDYNNCNIVLKELLNNTMNIDKADLSECLLYLFKDCCPSYEGLQLIVQVMEKYGILYDVVNKYIPRSVNPYSDTRGRARKFFK